jgi:Uma2 family endonuclease
MATGTVPEESTLQRGRRASAARTGITYEQYLRMPETMKRYEVIDGEMIMSPAPSDRHQFGIADVHDALNGFVKRNKVGFVLLAPVDVVIARAPRLKLRQPDLAYWSTRRVGGTKRAEFLQARASDVAPDLVVEVLSPDETRRRLSSKLADYAAIGITEVWLVGEQLEAIEVFNLHEGSYERAGLYGRGDMAESRVLAGFTLDVDTLFEEEG